MKARMDTDDLLLGSCQGAEEVQLVIFGREYNPLPATALHY
jgi:hypothetical protein